VELNQTAFNQLNQLPFVNAICSSIQDFKPETSSDLIFTCGVLIHVSPDDLPLVYEKIYSASKKYILINEYYNPSPVELEYRGHSSKLFKRDFAGELVDKFPHHFEVVDYGFLWKRVTPTWDNTTWFLLEKIA
jgi:pseudaminic acid biosynthesis-associated methylase